MSEIVLGIEPETLGIPDVVLFGGVTYGNDVYGEFIQYECFGPLLDLIMLTICSCDVNLTDKHIKAMCIHFDWSISYLSEYLKIPKTDIIGWKNNVNKCPHTIQTLLKYLGRTVLEPNTILLKFIWDMKYQLPTTNKLNFTYNSENNSWSWTK